MDIEVKRLDHLGIVAGVIKDLKLIEAIDERLQKDSCNQEKITPGEAIAGMIINGLGFSNKPLSLTPHFFETKALESLFRPGVKAEYFNRHKLGKALDRSAAYGCEALFFELSAQSCFQEAIDTRFSSEDTTSFSVTGEYAVDTDEHTIKITHGYSKDHRQDLKQVVQELLVSQDGGVPLMMKSWDGNASDNKIFKERAQLLIANFQQSESPRYLIADAKLYFKENAVNLKQLNFITRIPRSIKEERELISESMKENTWEKLDDENKYCLKKLTHYGIEQRWIVVYSQAARARSEQTLNKAIKKEFIEIEKQLRQLSNHPYDCANDAQKAVETLIKNYHYHKIHEKTVSHQKVYGTAGRPKKGNEPAGIKYFVTATVVPDKEKIKTRWDEKSCYVIGTNISEQALNAMEVIAAYKRQNSSIENMGFRFLKDPLFFVSSLFLKKPARIMGLLMVMTLALLVYSIAQRRLRKALKESKQMLPNQINKPTSTPTLRWLFQLMDGVDVVNVKIGKTFKTAIHGLNEIKRKIICFMGEMTMKIYGIQENADFNMGVAQCELYSTC